MPGEFFISQAELDEIRGEQVQMIAEIGNFVDIKRPTFVKDGRGGHTTTFVTQANIPARVWISSGPNGTSEETRFWGEEERFQTDAFMVVAYDTDLLIGDWIRWDDKDWKVVGVQVDDTFRTAIRARLVAMRDGRN